VKVYDQDIKKLLETGSEFHDYGNLFDAFASDIPWGQTQTTDEGQGQFGIADHDVPIPSADVPTIVEWMYSMLKPSGVIMIMVPYGITEVGITWSSAMAKAGLYVNYVQVQHCAWARFKKSVDVPHVWMIGSKTVKPQVYERLNLSKSGIKKSKKQKAKAKREDRKAKIKIK
jgi:hypothetical protein